MSYKEKLLNIKNGILSIVESSKELPSVTNETASLTTFDESLDLLLKEDSSLMQMSFNSLKETVRLIILLDVSYSMYGTEKDIAKGIQELIRRHQNDNILFNLVVFWGERQILFDDTYIGNVTMPEINLGGSTNLNGSLYYTMKNKCRDGLNLLVTISDGGDNVFEVSSNKVKALMQELNNSHNNFYFLGEPTLEDTPEDVYKAASELGFREENISVFTRKGNGNKLNFEVISEMLDELLKYGKISKDWSFPIKEHYLALTDKKALK